jgi:hypothetical protein
MDCIKCGMEEVESGRLAIGYRICLTCGEQEAQVESERKSRRIAIAYDKGAYQYITDADDPKDFG